MRNISQQSGRGSGYALAPGPSGMRCAPSAAATDVFVQRLGPQDWCLPSRRPANVLQLNDFLGRHSFAAREVVGKPMLSIQADQWNVTLGSGGVDYLPDVDAYAV